MSDETGAGASGAGGSVESSGGGGGSEAARSFKEQASFAVMKHGTMDDFVAETRDRKAEEEGDANVELPHRKEARADRIKRAVEAARRGGESVPYQRAESQNASYEPSEVHGDYEAHQRERDNIVRATAQYQMRVAEFSRSQPDYLETIKTLEYFPPDNEVAAELLESSHGPAITYALANNIDALIEFNEMSPQQAKRWIAKWEGQLEERAASQQHALPPRKATRAPAPLTKLNGGASKPSSNDPAKMSMSEYATWWKRQERRRLEEKRNR
jgi:hypothetical protein